MLRLLVRASPRTNLRLLLCPHLRICIWLGRGSESDRFTDTADGVQSTMLVFESFGVFLFGLLINRSISDKTSNCFNVVSLSVLASAMNATKEGGQKPGCGFNLRTGSPL